MPSASGPASRISSSVPTNDTVRKSGFQPFAWDCFRIGATVFEGPTTTTASGFAAFTVSIAPPTWAVCRWYDATATGSAPWVFQRYLDAFEHRRTKRILGTDHADFLVNQRSPQAVDLFACFVEI